MLTPSYGYIFLNQQSLWTHMGQIQQGAETIHLRFWSMWRDSIKQLL